MTNETKQLAEELLEEILNSVFIMRYDKLSPEEKITYGKPFISKQLLKLVQQGHL